MKTYFKTREKKTVIQSLQLKSSVKRKYQEPSLVESNSSFVPLILKKTQPRKFNNFYSDSKVLYEKK